MVEAAEAVMAPMLLWPALLMAALLAAMMPSALAQGSGEPRRLGEGSGPVRIQIASVVLAEPASETALPIEIGPVEQVPRNSLLRVRGMPAKAALSEGHAVGPGAWAVPMAAVPRLRVVVPVGLSGKSEVAVALVTIDGAVVAETRFALLIGSAGLIAPSAAADEKATGAPAAGPERQTAKAAKIVPILPPAGETTAAPVSSGALIPPAPAESARPTPKAEPAPSPMPQPAPPLPAARAEPPKVPPLSAEAAARARALLVRGEALLRDGDIVSARLFFERAADAGLADGALALGGTYAPHELAGLGVHGLKPEPATARRWYDKARDLGSAAASGRLARLGP